jgi:WD40 repeat protein
LDSASGRELLFVHRPGGVGGGETFAPVGSWLAAQDGDGRINLWDTTDGHVRLTIPAAKGLGAAPSYSWPFTIAPDGRTLACRTDDARSAGVELWDLATGRLVATLGHACFPLAFSPDGRTLAAALPPASSHQVLFWDVAGGCEIGRAGDDSSRVVSALAFSPDGLRLAWEAMPSVVVGPPAPDSALKLYDRPSGRLGTVGTVVEDRALPPLVPRSVRVPDTPDVRHRSFLGPVHSPATQPGPPPGRHTDRPPGAAG